MSTKTEHTIDKGQIISTNISERKGEPKIPVEQVIIDDRGIIGDAHAGFYGRQVSLLSQESIERFSHNLGRIIPPGGFAENLTTQGLDLNKVALLDRFRIGSIELEVTQIGKKCHNDGCAIFREIGKCVMPKEGIFCRVIRGGKMKAGETIEHHFKPLKILIVTMSDRVIQGVYQDTSGEAVRTLIQKHFEATRWHLQLTHVQLADEDKPLKNLLKQAIREQTDFVFTLGGTGIGPRDITPDTVMKICDKTLPGVMESIRVKYGATHPAAWLSRSMIGIQDKTQIYVLPGSVRAVTEYCEEIFKILEHSLCMLHALDSHTDKP